MPITSLSFDAFHMPAMTFVMVAYLATLLCVIVVELHPGGRIGRVAALSSIALVSAGGAAWSYAALYQKSQWPEIAAYKRAADDDASARRYVGRRGGEIDPESESASGRAASGSGRVDADGAKGSTVSGGGPSQAIILAQMLGLANRTEASESDTIIDCNGCPAMVMVPPGTAIIGAAETDLDATPAERPQREVRFWPGYMISAAPISAQSFREFMIETNRRVWSCGPQMASRDGAAVGELPEFDDARCVMPGDADAYAAWLSARTGKNFRLPTAAEWEYAARALSPVSMRRGHVAELVGDCWHATLPAPGRERIATQTSVLDCNGRMTMGDAHVNPGSADGEPKLRLSARRHLEARETRADIGFRVMRAIADGR